jgi:hypothetical protein
LAVFAGRIRDCGPLGWALILTVVVAAVLLVVAEFVTISYRTIGIGACSDRVSADVCHTSGHESHSFALLVLVPLALVMGWGAVVGRSRAASFALAAVGVAVLVIALVIDLPKLHDKRGLDVLYAPPVLGHTGSAFKVELTGGVLLLLAGGLALARVGGVAGGAGAGASRRLGRAGPSEAADEEPESARERRMRERAERRRKSSGAAVAESGAAAREPAVPEPTGGPAVPEPAGEPATPEPAGEPATPEPGGEPATPGPTEEPATPEPAEDLSPDAYRKPSGEPNPDPPEAPPAG